MQVTTKSVEYEAIKFDENAVQEVIDYAIEKDWPFNMLWTPLNHEIKINIGGYLFRNGDYLIVSEDGELTKCLAADFEDTYEVVPEEPEE